MRWREIVEMVDREPGIASEALAARFQLSERSIRALVHEANGFLAPCAQIRRRRGEGYHLEVSDADAYEALISERGSARPGGHEVPATHGERVSYLLNDLLMRNDWVLLDDLADACACSRSTLSLDLRDVEHTLSKYDLVLERRPRYGMRVTGTELNRRLCLAASTVRGVPLAATRPEEATTPSDRTGAGGGSIAAWLGENGVERGALEAISEAVERALADSPLRISALSYQNLLVHIAIALVRIKAGCYVPLDVEAFREVERSREYETAAMVARGIRERLGIELPDEEVAYIALHLAGKRTVYDAPSQGGDEGNLVISDEVWHVVGEMLEAVSARFHFDFNEDLELRMNLARHLVPLAVRLRSQMSLANPLLPDITARYPLAWSMAICVADTLCDAFGSYPSNDELGYIAMAFALALERQRGQLPRKRLLVVCASGAGSARLLEYRCQKEFGAYVESIETCDVMHVTEVDFSKIDYVFTTVPISVKLPVPVRHVSYFFDTTEAEGIRHLLRNGAGVEGVCSHFSPNLFFPHLAFDSKEEVLTWLCAAAREVHGGCEGLEALVMEREAAAATSFGNDVAMPHPLESVSDDTFVTVGLLDEPVVWDQAGTSVRAVFLICFSRKGGRELDAFLNVLAEVFTDEGAIARLVDRQDWETLTGILEGA